VIERARERWPILSYWQYFGYDLKLMGEGRWRRGRCPFHKDAHPSFWVDVDHGRWGCHAENIQGDVVDFHARRLGTGDQAQAARDLLTYDIRFSI
jgi:DNA primase